MDATAEHCNSRVEELEFLISIMSDLAHKYSGHNETLLEELISNLKYRQEKEEHTLVAKSRSALYPKQNHP